MLAPARGTTQGKTGRHAPMHQHAKARVRDTASPPPPPYLLTNCCELDSWLSKSNSDCRFCSATAEEGIEPTSWFSWRWRTRASDMREPCS